MRFRDSETQKLLRDTARAYLRDKYPWERLYALERGDARFAEADLKAFAEMGWLGLPAPESRSGGGLSLLEAAVVVDECGYAGVPAPIAAANVAAGLIATSASPDAGRHLADLAAGRRLYTVSEATRRRARPAPGDSTAPLAVSGGGLSGVLPLVPFGEQADFALAPVTVDGAPAFAVVPLEGAQREAMQMLDRQGYGNLRFENTDAAALLVLARDGEAEALHERCDALNTAFSLIELAGLMQRVLEMTGEYIANRVQFGQPIAKFQAARHHAADLLMATETTRWTAYHALWGFEMSGDAREIWLAKHWAIRACQRAFEITHLLHGGIGVGLEYPLHLYTQAMAAFAVRNGTLNEMVTRVLDSLELRGPAGR